MTVLDNVRARILRLEKARPFPGRILYSLGSKSAVNRSIRTLMQDGAIERVWTGYYVRPKCIPNLPGISYSASVDDVVQLWAKERGYVLVCQDMEESYRLGFQTQCPMASVYWSNGPTRNFRIGQSVAYVRHMPAKFLVWPGRPIGCLYRAMQAVTVESISFTVFCRACERLQLGDAEMLGTIHNLLTSKYPSDEWKSKLVGFTKRLEIQLRQKMISARQGG